MSFLAWIPQTFKLQFFVLVAFGANCALSFERLFLTFDDQLAYASGMGFDPQWVVFLKPALFVCLGALLDWFLQSWRERSAMIATPWRTEWGRARAGALLVFLAALLGHGVGFWNGFAPSLTGWLTPTQVGLFTVAPSVAFALLYLVIRLVAGTPWILVVLVGWAMFGDVSPVFPLFALGLLRGLVFDGDHPFPRRALAAIVVSVLGTAVWADQMAQQAQLDEDSSVLRVGRVCDDLISDGPEDGRPWQLLVQELPDSHRSAQNLVDAEPRRIASMDGGPALVWLAEVEGSTVGPRNLVRILEDGGLEWMKIDELGSSVHRPECQPFTPKFTESTVLGSDRAEVVYAGTPGDRTVVRIERDPSPPVPPYRLTVHELTLPEDARFEGFVVVTVSRSWISSVDTLRKLVVRTDRGLFLPNSHGPKPYIPEEKLWFPCEVRVAETQSRSVPASVDLKTIDGELVGRRPLQLHHTSRVNGALAFRTFFRPPLVPIATALGPWTAPIGVDLAVQRSSKVLLPAGFFWLVCLVLLRIFLRRQGASRARQRFWFAMFLIGGPVTLLFAPYAEWCGRGLYTDPGRSRAPRLQLRSASPISGS